VVQREASLFPPIADLTQAGYKLAGGRIDLLANRPVAAIVYEHENRFINVFVWPVGDRAIDFSVSPHNTRFASNSA
jgi:anti-sigma factor RsiW